MKKRLFSLVIALVCLIMPVLTSCGADDEYKPYSSVKAITITFYGIKGEGTTDEAVKAVQDALNVYSEGKLNTRVLLRLFTEDEYYEKLNEAFDAAQKYKDDKKNNKDDKNDSADKPAETGDKNQKFEMEYPDEQGTQVDIFMVRGSKMFQKYNTDGYTVALSLSDKSGLAKKYISERYLALTSINGTPTSGGLLEKQRLHGVINNTVSGEYTYLLVNKEIADNYGYAANNLDTLSELQYFLSDAASDYSDYITLYNAPVINTATIDGSLLGGVINEDSHAYSKLDPVSLLEDSAYVEYSKYLNLFESKNYITEGSYYSLPEGKVAAAFLKGNAALAEKYSEDYIVVPYAKPVMEDIGTVFCVSKYAANAARCLEIIGLLQTNVDYRNTFQYGVENVHYTVNEYTGMLNIISNEYNMDPADTGNLFILKENSSMDEATKALAANDWALAKQQYRDTIISPYTLFNPDFTGLNGEGFMAVSDSYKEQLMSYVPGSEKTFEEHASELNGLFKESDEYKFFAEPSEAVEGAPVSIGTQYITWCEKQKIA